MISPEGLSVPALLDAPALDNREAAAFPALAAQRGPAVRVPEAACLRSVAVAAGSGLGAAFQSWEAVLAGSAGADLDRRVAELGRDVRPEDEFVVSRPAAQAESA